MEEDPIATWQFDSAIHRWGNWLEWKTSQLHEKTGKPKFKLEQFLRDPIKNPTLWQLQKSMSEDPEINYRGINIR